MPIQFSDVSQVHSARCTSFGVAIVALLFAPASHAQQWRVEPSIGAGLEYDDNASLITNEAIDSSTSGYLVEVDTRFSRITQLSDFSLTPAVRLRRYDDLDALDADDYFLDMRYTYTGLRSRFWLRGNYSNESIRTAERADVDFDITDPTEIPTDDSGRVLDTDDRQRLMFAPTWRYRLGQRTFVRLGGQYYNVGYDSQTVDMLVDYTAYTVDGALGFEMSERDSVALVSYFRQNDFEPDTEFSGYGIAAEYTRALSETTDFLVRVGADTSEDQNAQDQTNPVGEISLTRQIQNTRLVAAYQRTIGGSGAGILSVRDAINLNVSHDLSEKFSIGAGVRAYQNESLDSGVIDFSERDYLQFRALFTWRLTRAWSVDFDYRYSYLDRAALGFDADSNLVNLWFRYSGRL